MLTRPPTQPMFVLLFLSLFLSPVIAAESPDENPKSLPAGIEKMDADTLRLLVRQLCFQIDDLQEKVNVAEKEKSLPPVATVTNNNTPPKPAAPPPKKWVMQVVQLHTGDFEISESEKELKDLTTRRYSYASDEFVGDLAHGEWQLKQARSILNEMESDNVRTKNKAYSAEQVSRQRIVVRDLESNVRGIKQRITTLQKSVEDAKNTVIIIGFVVGDNQPVTVTAKNNNLTMIARRLAPDEKIAITGFVKKQDPLEIVANTIVPVKE